MSNNKLHTAIEVVHSNDDSEEKIAYYQENEINVIRINIKDFDSYILLKKSTKYIHNFLTQDSYLYKSGCMLPVVTTKEMFENQLKWIRQKELKAKREMEIKELQILRAINYEKNKKERELGSTHNNPNQYILKTSQKYRIPNSPLPPITLPQTTFQEKEEIANIILDHVSSAHYNNTFTLFGIARRVPHDSSYYLRVCILNSLIDHALIEISTSGYKVKHRKLPFNFTPIIPEALLSKY